MSAISKPKSEVKPAVWLKKLPTLLTIGNSLCGFTAILHALLAYQKKLIGKIGTSDLTIDSYVAQESFESIFATCAWLIIGAMVFDALDGWAARKLKATSLHGLEMDSLADMVTFGVAPAVVVAVMAHTNDYFSFDPGIAFPWVWLCTAFYLGCTASRLAFYNVQATSKEKSSHLFSGLPSPGAAAAIASIIILHTHQSLNLPPWLINSFLPLYTACLGFLMVSTIPFFHVGQWLSNNQNRRGKLLLVAFIVLMACLDVKITAAVLINLYVCSGPLSELTNWFSGKRAAKNLLL